MNEATDYVTDLTNDGMGASNNLSVRKQRKNKFKSATHPLPLMVWEQAITYLLKTTKK